MKVSKFNQSVPIVETEQPMTSLEILRAIKKTLSGRTPTGIYKRED